ncbi:MAG TPA: PAS domain S-box protein [Pilimelia sp.]|nr:PAS domain S-box protein [Pilimelia sp.]
MNTLRGDPVHARPARQVVSVFRSSTLRSADLLEAAPDAIVLTAGDGTIVLVNAQVERLFGYRREELVGQPIEVLVPTEAQAAHPWHRERYLADPQPRPMGHGQPLAARRRDGTEFPAEISLSVIDTGDGRLVAAAVRDVTDRRRAAEAQARLASIVESSDESIIGYTLDGVITSWNAAAERLYGYSAPEVVGRSALVLVPPDRVAEEQEALRRATRGERLPRYRTRRRRKDGSLVTVSRSLSPVIDSSGTIVGAASVSRDLTEHELAEAKFQALLEAAPDAIVGVGRDGRIVLANAQAERLLGYARAELIGRPVEILVPEPVRAGHRHLRDRYFADPLPRPMGAETQLTAVRRDGTEFPAEISLSALDTEDGVIVSASIRDVTDRLEAQAERARLKAQAERERLEAQLHQARRLESLGQLAGGVAHDFNNLLAVILNYSAFVEEELQAAIVDGEGGRWAAAHRDVGQIQRAAQRAITLTHQLLTFGRREVVRPRVLDVNDVVREVEGLLRRTLGEHIDLAVDPAPGLWRVRADAGHLEQVLMNLAVNARQAMPGGGRLRVDTGNVTVGPAGAVPDRHGATATGPPGAVDPHDGTAADPHNGTTATGEDAPTGREADLPPGRYVRLRVRDTGRGMAPEVLAHAFEPFFTTKPKGEGTGLGLATVYGIVTQAGGRVWIDSAPGVGTTVTALLPATEEEATAEEEPEPTPAGLSGRGETVLVVEDEDAMRDVTQRILERHGYRVITADRGAAALELIGQLGQQLDLLLTDVVMPHMLGKELADRVTQRFPHVRVLYMSGYARPVLAEEGTLEPGVALVSKPFSEQALLSAVRDVLDRGSAGVA